MLANFERIVEPKCQLGEMFKALVNLTQVSISFMLALEATTVSLWDKKKVSEDLTRVYGFDFEYQKLISGAF